MFSLAIRGNPNNTSDFSFWLLSFFLFVENFIDLSISQSKAHMWCLYFLILKNNSWCCDNAECHGVCRQSGEVHCTVSAMAWSGSCQFVHVNAAAFWEKKGVGCVLVARFPREYSVCLPWSIIVLSGRKRNKYRVGRSCIVLGSPFLFSYSDTMMSLSWR